jgi:uncharacterized protein YegP (UPF0339 family)
MAKKSKGYEPVVFYNDKKKEWRWRAVARNGLIVADSGEGYKSKAKAKHGALVASAMLVGWVNSLSAGDLIRILRSPKKAVGA